ncbi:MAG: GNAT family N-acetyltransferase [Ignavibacteria bacterium]|nr:GNAT family N-acetyltransferase [Ignavibacteria bacterium]
MKNEVVISLREINESNWRECIALSVREDQKKFVGTNENGLALAYAHKEMRPRGIYADEEMVGFIMYAMDPDDGLYYINRFMIDASCQGRGFGRRALRILTEQLMAEGVTSVDILHKPDNEQAVRLYMSLGFKLTDERVGDDVISRLEMRV